MDYPFLTTHENLNYYSFPFSLLLTYIAHRNLRKNLHHRIILGFCTTLLLFLAIFIVILYNDELHKTTAACKSLAIILHYVLLCAFMWMVVDATLLYKQIIIVFDDTSGLQKRLLFSSICGKL